MKRTIIITLALLGPPAAAAATVPPATTPAPTGTTVPAPITYTGHGDYVVDLGVNERFVAFMSHSGRSNFIVEALDAVTGLRRARRGRAGSGVPRR